MVIEDTAMTKNQSAATKQSVDVAVLPEQSFFARVIEDPFASAIAASIACFGALGVVLSSMWVINTVLY